MEAGGSPSMPGQPGIPGGMIPGGMIPGGIVVEGGMPPEAIAMGGAMAIGGPGGAMPPGGLPGGVAMAGAVQVEGMPGGMAMGAVQIEGMPGGMAMGAVEVEGMPGAPAVEGSAFFIEYRFVKPVKYSGHRIVASHQGAECDPSDWEVVVDQVDHETGERLTQDLTIQSVANGVQQERGAMREFQLKKEEDVFVDRIKLVVSRSQGGGPVSVGGFSPIVTPSVINSDQAPEARLPWKFTMKDEADQDTEMVRFFLIPPPVPEEGEAPVVSAEAPVV